MKQVFYYLLSLLFVFNFAACSDDDEQDLATITYPLNVKLVYPEEVNVNPSEGVTVTMKDATTGTETIAKTNAEGIAAFELPEGLYEASATDKRVVNAKVLLFNGLNSNVQVSATTQKSDLKLEVSQGGSIVIKELYVGGCQKNDGSGTFIGDQYVVLYNNSTEALEVGDFALGMVNPFNSTGSNKDYIDGQLSYAKDHAIPAGVAVWYFESKKTLASGEQMVIALKGAINHTTTYTNSVDLSKSSYYCTYDIEDFDNEKNYPAPSEAIPTSQYLKAYKYGLGNAWPLSIGSPAFFIFRPDGQDLKAFVDDPTTTNLYGGNKNMARKMVPEAWIIDGIEVFKDGATNNMKRLTPAVDAGYVDFTNGRGYTLYRNVDKAATEAIEGNKEKLVYNYALGVESTDPSGIDAEASLKNGAKIIYMDTNNSSKDFHQRKVASLKN